jgi:glycosyltransferase involved in cell wall biosynthesis
MEKGLSIIIPVYNESKSIEKTLDHIRGYLGKAEIPFEIITVNDGSNDGSESLLQAIPGIILVNHKKNRGYGASLKTGLRHSRFDVICITDADETYPNDRIPELYGIFRKNGLDMLVGSRTGDNISYPFIKKIPKFFIIKLANYITNSHIPDINSGLRVFSKKRAMEFFHLYPDGFSFTTTITCGMLSRGYEVEFIPIDYFKREGKSKIHPIRDTAGFFKLLLKIALYFNPFKFFKPIILVFGLISVYFLVRDLFYLQDLTQGSIFFPVVTLIFFSLGLMADLIIKHSSR